MEPTDARIRELLLKVGISVNNIWDLVNTRESYPEAIPVLIEILTTEELDDRTKEGVIRSLAVKEAKGKINKILIDEFNNTSREKHTLRWVIGSAMYTVAIKADLNEILEIVLNKENGKSRQMFVSTLGRMKSNEAEAALIYLLDDDDVVLHALSSLGRLKCKEAKGKIEELFNHPRPVIRRKAKAIASKL